MDKKSNFEVLAPYIYEDGTYDCLLPTLHKHPQTNQEIIKKAADLIGDYICFCMDVTTSYYCEKHKKYEQFAASKGCSLNLNRWEIEFMNGEKLRAGETINQLDKNTQRNIKSFRELERINRGFFTSEKEKERVEKYGYGYYYLLAKYLDGES